jgi:carbamoylphosphate synthase small subunit
MAPSSQGLEPPGSPTRFKAKTEGSLQSIQEVLAVAGALGVDDRKLVKRITPQGSQLRRLFEARNRIVHELDLQEAGGGQRQQRDRAKDFTEDATREATEVAQLIIDKVAAQLRV